MTITASDTGYTCADAICIFPERVAGAHFRRGDTDANGRVNLTDTVRILYYLFSEEDALPCSKAADTDDNGVLDMSDAVLVLNYLFRSGPPPAEPLQCGADATEDELDCDAAGDCRPSEPR